MPAKFGRENLLLTMYTYFFCGLVGTLVLKIFLIYWNTDEDLIHSYLIKWYDFQQYYIGVVFIACLLFFILISVNSAVKKEVYGLNITYLRYHLIVQSFLIASLLLSHLSLSYSFHFNLLELISVLLALISLFLLSNGFYYSTRHSWRTNSTRWGFFYSALLIGYGFLINLESVNLNLRSAAYTIIVLLCLELGRLVLRFRFLYLHSHETHSILRMLLGKYLIYFGVRTIVGIFIPVVYIIYGLLTHIQFIKLVGILLLLGEFMEKVLLIFIASPGHLSSSENSKQHD